MKTLRLPKLLPAFLALALLFGPPLDARADAPPELLMIWGSSGTGNGQFNSPTGITVDENGFVYVCESSNNRVQKFDGEGNFIAKWGSSGSSSGEFYQPHGIHADGSGFIYVADSGNHRIQKFTTDGVFVSSFGFQGSGNGEFSAPRGVTTDAGGNILVADTFNHRMQKFNSSGDFLSTWGSNGSGDGQMIWPNGIDIDGLGQIYVSEIGNHRVQVFSNAGAFVRKWGTQGSGNGNFESPMGVALVGASLYVVSNNGPNVQGFTNIGGFLTKWGQLGSGPLDFNSPRGIDVDGSGNLYITDSVNNRVKKYGSGPSPFENVLTVGTGRGLPGLGAISVPVGLSSTEAASGLEIRIVDTPDWFHVTGVTLTGRATAMTSSFTDGTGGVHILVYSPTGNRIGFGDGDILSLTGTIDPGASEGDSASLNVSVVLMADAAGQPVTIDSVDGILHIERIAGDVNGDNFLDAGDIVRLIEIILGTGDVPTPGELLAADCNLDTEINVFDVACLINLILGVPQAPEGRFVPLAENLVDLSLELRQTVKAIQFTLPSGTTAEATGELGSFMIKAGVDAGGRNIVMAFDPQGGAWQPGSRSPLRLGAVPTSFRAYGAGGRPLPVTISGSEIRIGAPVPAGLSILSNRPNPFRRVTAIRFTLDRSGPVRLSVYDVRGTLVFRSAERNIEAGEHSWNWDATGDSGRRLSSGLYMGVIEAGESRATARLVLTTD